MFRSMRRFAQQVSEEACKEILRTEPRAALAVIGDDGYPYAIPVDFYYDEAENRIYIHGAREGHKVDAIAQCDKVCLTVWNQGFKKEGHWEWNSTSVVVFGRAHVVTDPVVVEERLRSLGNKYNPSPEDVEEEIRQHIARVQMYAIEIEHMTGKLVNER